MTIRLDDPNRRRFMQWLAASPLLASNAIDSFAAESPSKLPDPMVWAPTNQQQLIKAPKEAINVFDFEPVARANVPPAHAAMWRSLDKELNTSFVRRA